MKGNRQIQIGPPVVWESEKREGTDKEREKGESRQREGADREREEGGSKWREGAEREGADRGREQTES